MTPEGKVKHEVDLQLALYLAYRHKPVQNGMGEPALDYHGCHKGLYLGIETKRRGEGPTKRQVRTMRKIKAAGGSVFLIMGLEGADMAQLIGWLINPVPGFISTAAACYLSAKEEPDESRNDRHGDPESEV